MKINGLTDKAFVHTVIRRRPRDVHKGDCGKVLLICGSKGMAGASVFASRAAMKSGSGLVKVCTVEDNFPVLQISVPEVICTLWDDIKGELGQFDAVAMGPGMGAGERTRKILTELLKSYDKTIVIDADGLNVVAKDEELGRLIREYPASVIMTPHIVEAGRLIGGNGNGEKKAGTIDAKELSKLEIGQLLFEKYSCIAVVKGAATLVAVSEENAYTNTTGNPGMATAGSGDVLTGVIASLAGQGLDAGDAARAGVFVHGMSGDIAAENLGEYGLTASDIVNNLPFALKKVLD